MKTSPAKKSKTVGDSIVSAIDDVKKKESSKTTAGNDEEKSFDDDKKGKKVTKKEPALFNDKNLDYNLIENDANNVISRKIKVSNNLLITCKMIEGSGEGKGGLTYDYAALTFQRKTKDEKSFDFNMPLSLCPSIIRALTHIIEDNPKFFSKNQITLNK
jgi:hypothetical protein